MFWFITAVMLIGAILFIAVPLYRSERKVSATAIGAGIVVAALSATMYSQIGTPRPDENAMPDIDQMVSSLAARLQENPDDLPGWKMLGRSYLQLQNFAGAIAAFEKAVEMESGSNAQTLADLGEAVLMDDNRTIIGRAGQLFESALAVDPVNPKALFYAGMSAMQRGDNSLAADRWEALLATSPPENIQGILRQRIAELRGEPVAPASPVATPSGPVVTASVSLGAAATEAALADTTVFIIARDPNQPSPPIAAVRRRLSELPAEVTIGDGDAMIPGRVPSAFATLEIIARVSLTGEPIAQPGDWYGDTTVDTATTNEIQIVIDQQMP